MDAADVALRIDAEIIEARQEVRARQLAGDRREAPQESQQRPALVTRDLDGGTASQRLREGKGLECPTGRADVHLELLAQRGRDLRRYQPFHLDVSVVRIIARDAHRTSLARLGCLAK